MRTLVCFTGLLLLAGCGGNTPTPPPPPPPNPIAAPLRGGSALLAWKIPADATSAHGVIAEFHLPEAHAAVVQQIQQMYANGQRTINLPILFIQGAADGIALDSTGGTLTTQQGDNLAGLLALIKQIGFERMELSFIAEWTNDPANWVNPGAWSDQGYGNCTTNAATGSVQGLWYTQNLEFIGAVREIVKQSGIAYVTNLGDEDFSATYQAYATRLWADYVALYSSSDTIGFAMVPTPASVALIPTVYRGTYPTKFDVHIYDGNDYGYGLGASATFAGLDRDLRKLGLLQPLIEGEALTNDAITATALMAASKGSGRPIAWLTQWPIQRGDPPGTTQSVYPVAYSAYLQAGF